MVPTPDSSTRTWFIHIYPPFYRPMVAWPLGSSFLEFSKGSLVQGLQHLARHRHCQPLGFQKNTATAVVGLDLLTIGSHWLIGSRGPVAQVTGCKKAMISSRHMGVMDSWAHGPSTGSFYITPYKVWLPQLPLGMVFGGTAPESRYFPIIIH